MIACATARIEDEIDLLPLQMMELIDAFGHWSGGQKLPVPVITCIKRTPEENFAIYKANRPSLHIEFENHVNAVDLRTRHYNAVQLDDVIAWFKKTCADATKWELITKLHGTGPHLHVGLRRPPATSH